MTNPAPNNRLKTVPAWYWSGLIIGMVVLGQRFLVLSRAPFLSGADAYYYALQVKFLVLTGALKIPDSSPLLTLMGLTGRMGLPWATTVGLWTVLITLLTAGSLVLAARLTMDRNQPPVLPLLLFAWAIISPSLAFTAIEFPKYAFALIFLPWWPVGLYQPRWWWVSLLAMIMAALSHLAVLALAGLILPGLLLSGRLPLRFNRPGSPWLAVAAGAGLVGLGLIVGKYFLVADLTRIHLTNLQPGIWTLLNRPELPLALKLEVGGAVLLSLFSLMKTLFNKASSRGGFWSLVPLTIALLPLGSDEVMGISERLCLLLPLLSCWALYHSRLGTSRLLKGGVLTLLFTGFAMAIFLPHWYLEQIHPRRLNPDYLSYDRVTRAISRLPLPKIPMLIAHQGINYYYKYQTMQESFPYEPESHWPKARIWRLSYGITPAEWAYYLPEQYLWGSGLLYDLPGEYDLVREDLWELFRDQVRQSANDELKVLVSESWLNPSRPRPEFARQRASKEPGEFSAYP